MFANKTVIVTGSSAGIGQRIAIEFAKHKANLILHGRNKINLQKSKELCIQAGLKEDKIAIVEGDIREEAVQVKLLETAEEKFGSLHVLVNNAGTGKPKSVLDFDMEIYNETMDTNLKSVFSLCTKAIPALRKSNGNIVNISSACSSRAVILCAPYCIAKAGLDMLTKCLATELGTIGVRVNSVNPGVIYTELVRKATEKDKEAVKKIRAAHPINRMGEVDDIAHTVAFLASEKAKFVTGAIWHVDGGLSANQLDLPYK